MLLINGYRNLNIITFSPVSGTFVESPAGTWGSGTGFAVATKTIASGGSGRILATHQGNGFGNVVAGMDSTSVLEDYTGFDYGVYSEASTNLYRYVVSGSTFATGISSSANDLFGINRVGSVITAEYYRNGVWTVLFTFSSSYTGQLWLKFALASGSNSVINPKGSGIS